MANTQKAIDAAIAFFQETSKACNIDPGSIRLEEFDAGEQEYIVTLSYISSSSLFRQHKIFKVNADVEQIP